MNNPINKVLLWLMLLPKGLYKKLDVNVVHLKAILTTKLMIDDRRVTGLQKVRRRNPDKEVNTATVTTMIVSVFMGALLVMIFFLKDDLTRLTFYFGSFSFFLAMFLITDFSDILIDPKDNYIILPKPISSPTFIVGRLLHILIHLTKIVIPLSIPAMIAIFISRGVLGEIGFIFCILFLTLLTFALVNAAYLLIIRVFSPTKLNSVITTMQIFFSVILYASSQLLPRFLDRSEMENMVLYPSVFLWLVPVYWFAKAWVFIHTLQLRFDLILGFLLSMTIPLVGLWMVVRYLAPAFFRKISLIQPEALILKPSTRKLATSQLTGLALVIARLWTKAGLERASFAFVWKMTGRARDYKMKVYPGIGYMIVIILLFVFRSWDQLVLASTSDEYVDGGKLTFLILSVIYISSFIFMGGMLQLPFTENFKAAWVYLASPVTHPGEIIRGAIKVCLTKFLFSMIIIVTVVGLLLFGPSIIPNLVFGFSNVFLMCTILGWIAMDRLPFSISIKNQGKGQITFRNLFMLFALGFFGIPHYFLFHHPIIMSIISVFTLTAAILILHFTKNIQWANIKAE